MLRIVPISLQRIFNDNKREGPIIIIFFLEGGRLD